MQDRTDTPVAALWAAAYHGNLVIVERLIAEGVDVNVWDRRGRCALSFAARRGDLKMVRTLIAAGAWVDPHDDYSTFMSPLMCAAEGGHLETVELLLEHGANSMLFGGVAGQTAWSQAGGSPERRGLIATVLRRAEDEWHRKHPRT